MGVMGETDQDDWDSVFAIENPFLRWLCVLWILIIAIIVIIILTPFALIIKGMRALDTLVDRITRRH